ncbi:MAG: DUF3558 domain-containing protein, partial [Sciscionella sp.]
MLGHQLLGHRLAAAFLGAGVAAVLVAGCSSDGGEAGAPGTEPTAGAGGSEPTFDDQGGGASIPNGATEAPKIAQPLDSSKYLSQPCAALSASQLSALSLPANSGKQYEMGSIGANAGPGCAWENTADRSIVGVSFVTANKNGLSDLYRARATQPASYFGYFEPTTVAGYPAVFNDGTDGRSAGDCGIGVGI